MEIVDTLTIKAFGPMPKADVPILEIPASDLQGLLSEMVETYNLMVELVKDSGFLRGRELARLTARAQDSLKVAGSAIEKMLLLNAFIRQLLAKLRDGLKARPQAAGKVVQVCSKIAARAIKILDYIQVKAEGKKEIAIDSQEARAMLAGSGEKVSRKECIRAMHRAERICPALECQHRPNDGRRTMRLTGIAGEIAESIDRISWQRSGLTA